MWKRKIILNIIVSTLKILNNNCLCTSISPIYTVSLTGNIIVYAPSQGTNREKYSRNKQHRRLKCQLWRVINTSPSISSLIGRVFSIFRRKMDGPISSEKDIKVLIPSPTFLFIFRILHFHSWEKSISNPSTVKMKRVMSYKMKKNISALSLVFIIVISLHRSFIVRDCIDFSCQK